MPIVVICPFSHCSVRLSLSDDRAGTTFHCPKCGTAISVPVLVSPPPAPPPLPPPVEYDWPASADGDDEEEPEDRPPPRRRRRRDDDDDDYYYSRRGRRARKSRLAYILLALFFGFLGVHNFYVNRTGPGVAQLVVCLVSSVLLCVYVGIVGFVVLFFWNIVEIITVQRDGTGVAME